MTNAELKAAVLKVLGEGATIEDATIKAFGTVMKEELKSWVPQERFDEVVGQKKTLSETLETAQSELKTLKDSPENITKLKDTITQLQDKIKTQDSEFTAKLLNSQKDSAIQEAILSCGRKAYDTSLVSRMFDKEKIVIKDGTITGIKDQMDGLLKDKSFLFEPVEPETNFFKSHNTLGGSGGENKGKLSTDEGALQFAKELAATKRASLGLKTGADE